MEALDLAVGLGMTRRTVDVPDRERAQILLEGSRQGTRAAVAEEPGTVLFCHSPVCDDISAYNTAQGWTMKSI